MFNKNKNDNNHKKDWITIFLGFFSFWEVLKFFKKKRNKEIKENFIKFLKKEKTEIEELIEGKEKTEEFLEDSGNIFKDFFIPTKSNGYKPKILHSKTLIATGLILVGLKVVLVSYLFFIYPYQGRMDEFFNDQLLSLINRDRISQGDGTLQFNKELNFSAMNKAKDLIQNNYFAHVSPDGKKPWDWINRDNYKYLLVGENLAMNFTSPESVHRALMLSPSHKKNILNKEYKDVGLAVLNGTIDGKETSVLVELFSTRKEEDFKLASVSSQKEPIKPKQEEVIKAKQKEPIKSKQEEIIKPKNEIIPSASSNNEKDKIENNNQEPEKNIPNIKSIPAPPALPNFSDVIKSNLALSQAQVLSSELTEPKIEKQKEKEIAQIARVSKEGEDNNLYNSKVFANTKDDARQYTETKMQYFNYFLLAVLLLISAFLIINIIVRMEVQHKHVIIQTIFLIIFIAGLISFKFDFLSSLLPKILIV